MQRRIVVSQKDDEEMKRRYKAEIVALDAQEEERSIIIYYTDDFVVEGDFIRFAPKRCFAKLKSYEMKGVEELVLPSRLVLEAVKRS